MKRYLIKTSVCIATALVVAACARSSTPKASQQLAVSIARNGAVSVAGESCRASELAARLKESAAKQPTVVLVRADAGAPYRQMAAVLDACEAAGVQRVTLATTR